MSNPQPYESTGRTSQKARTRKALVEAARVLIAEGNIPTVEEAAAAASVARTTAYRYFPNQRDLLIAAHPEIEQRSLLQTNPPEDVETRLGIVVGEYLRQIVDNEVAYRTALRLALDPNGTNRDQLLLRQGRVITWLKDAFEPLRGKLSDPAIERLAFAIRATTGIEALVWLCDVAHLSRLDARELMMWSARALLESVLTEANVNPTGPVVEPGQQAPSGQPDT